MEIDNFSKNMHYGFELFPLDSPKSADSGPTHSGGPLDLLILDPGLKDMGSHHHHLNLIVARYFTARGVSVMVAANRFSTGQVFPYTVIPTFSCSPYRESETTSSQDYSSQVITTAAEVCSLLLNRKRPYVLP